jgi:serine/threonine protein kinase
VNRKFWTVRITQSFLIFLDSLASTFVGTLWYWPPERFDINNIARYDIRADVWSLGITLLETVYGRLPYNDISNKEFADVQKTIVNAYIEELIEKVYASQYSSHLVEFTTKCLNNYENRAKFNQLQNTKFCEKYKTESNNEVLKDFISKCFVSMVPYTNHVSKNRDF